MARKERKVVDYHTSLIRTGQTTLFSNLDGYQVTDTTNHPHWRNHLAKGRDVGGSFFTSKPQFKVLRNWQGSAPKLGAGSYAYSGTLLAEDPRNSFGVPADHVFTTTDRNLMVIKGATAISRVIPTNPLADASVALGELRMGGIPTIPGQQLLKSRLKDIRKAGSEYLNVEFGWKPLVSDLQKFSKSVIDSEKILDQLRRDAGRRVRRHYEFPKETVVSTATKTSVYPYPSMTVYNYIGGPGTKKTTTTTTREFWFSGSFSYYYPQGDKAMEKLARLSLEAKRLYGIRVTPDVLWNLSPWSWAADWVGNMGDNISNLSAFTSDGLVMPHGYIMYKRTTTVHVELTGIQTNDRRSNIWSQEYTTVDKMRLRATPYGFGLNDAGFSERQWAIIGALGIANAPGKRAF